MNDIDFNSMNDIELAAFVSAAAKEMERRRNERNEQKEALWRQVKLAIIDYANHFDDINIGHGEFYIDGSCDFSEPGQIY